MRSWGFVLFRLWTAAALPLITGYDYLVVGLRQMAASPPPVQDGADDGQ